MFSYIYFLFLTTTLIGLSGAANWCGTSWSDAGSKCRQACPSGVNSECPSGEFCFASVNCRVNPPSSGSTSTVTRWCGKSWTDANRCYSNSCPGGVDRECPSGQRCYGGISCSSNSNPSPVSPPSPPSPANPSSSSTGAVVSKTHFDTMFPSRDRLYSYKGFISAAAAFSGFLSTGTMSVRRREAAAFFANIAHESCNLRCTVELNTANYNSYCNAQTATENGFTSSCDKNGQRFQYYGRGPMQLSWNFNYKAAGDALGLDLLHNPNKVSTDSRTAWRTAIWFWMTSRGAGVYTPHSAIITGRGFGETIRSINGKLECDGEKPSKVAARVKHYRNFVQVLGTSVGPGNLNC